MCLLKSTIHHNRCHKTSCKGKSPMTVGLSHSLKTSQFGVISLPSCSFWLFWTAGRRHQFTRKTDQTPMFCWSSAAFSPQTTFIGTGRWGRVRKPAYPTDSCPCGVRVRGHLWCPSLTREVAAPRGIKRLNRDSEQISQQSVKKQFRLTSSQKINAALVVLDRK